MNAHEPGLPNELNNVLTTFLRSAKLAMQAESVDVRVIDRVLCRLLYGTPEPDARHYSIILPESVGWVTVDTRRERPGL